MRGRLEKLGVRMVAISPDTVKEAHKMKRKRGLGMIVLSDESLEVADLYNVRHDRAFVPVRGPVRPLVIPTTILVGGDGTVRWIDQTDDYRVRSDAARVLEVVERALAGEEVAG
ncbi:MAG: hypothetical protein D6760_11900 [Deltaproteobacteria bacterium]|nr:MAG: hypothetical protein D6760_11900 [Deltaproteobacteria bacterium]